MLWAQSHTRTIIELEPSTFRLFLWDCQPLATPKSLHAFVIHLPSFPAQQRCNTVMTVPIIRTRQTNHASYETWFIIDQMWLPTQCAPWLTQHTAGPAFTHLIAAESIAHVLYGRGALRRAYKFPEVATFKLALSSSASADSRFWRLFSFSNPFSRLAWSRCRPPHSFCQR